MRFSFQRIGNQLKQQCLVLFLAGVGCAQAYAQTTPSSLPSLPLLPSPSGVASVPVPQTPSAEVKVPAVVEPVKVEGSASTLASAPPASSAIAAVPETGLPPIGGITPASAEIAPTVSPLAASLPTALPSIPDLPPVADADVGGSSFPDKILSVKEKVPSKTWQTKLVPSIVPPKTNFRYKRVLLPEEIYASRYGKENRHLPRRVTRTEYEGMLFVSIARHNLEAVRALLNAGTYIDAVNAYGETPRMFAERIGAVDAAALLAARGGR